MALCETEMFLNSKENNNQNDKSLQGRTKHSKPCMWHIIYNQNTQQQRAKDQVMENSYINGSQTGIQISNTHKKKSSASLIIGEMQATWNFTYLPRDWLSLKRQKALITLQRKGNPCTTLLMKTYTNIAIIKKSTVWPQQPYYQKSCHYVNDIYTLMLNT